MGNSRLVIDPNSAAWSNTALAQPARPAAEPLDRPVPVGMLTICPAHAVGTPNAIYVRATEPAKVAALSAEHPTAYTEPGSEFYAIDQESTNFVPPETDLASLSDRLGTDVLWLGFQSLVDAFQFHHWRSGKHVRALVFGCFEQERTWERVEGEGEAWERATFFDDKRLARRLEWASSQDAEELRRIWREAEIKPGRIEPGIDGREIRSQGRGVLPPPRMVVGSRRNR